MGANTSGRDNEITAGRDTAHRQRQRPKGYIANYRPRAATVALLAVIKQILDTYANFLPLTKRQVFYILVGQYGFPKDEGSYNRLCDHMSNACRARVLSFDAIRDDGITGGVAMAYEDMDAFRQETTNRARRYRRHKLFRQEVNIEVLCEAAGMVPQLRRVTDRYTIRTESSSGFDSLTAKRALVDRIVRIDRPTVILHLGDLDPSGVSIFESMAADVLAFIEKDRFSPTTTVQFRRVALTEEHVLSYSLQTAPAKETDSRSRNWGDRPTCQLEALPPDIIASILDEEIRALLDMEVLAEDEEAERVERQQLLYLLPAPGQTAS